VKVIECKSKDSSKKDPQHRRTKSAHHYRITESKKNNSSSGSENSSRDLTKSSDKNNSSSVSSPNNVEHSPKSGGSRPSSRRGSRPLSRSRTPLYVLQRKSSLDPSTQQESDVETISQDKTRGRSQSKISGKLEDNSRNVIPPA